MPKVRSITACNAAVKSWPEINPAPAEAVGTGPQPMGLRVRKEGTALGSCLIQAADSAQNAADVGRPISSSASSGFEQ